MKTYTSAKAQNNFGELLDTVQREAVAITRHGRPTAYMISPVDMESLLDDQKRRKEAVKGYRAWRAKASKHRKPAAASLTDEEINRLVHELR